MSDDLLRRIAGLTALRSQYSSRADCSKCQDRETLLDCIASILTKAGYADRTDVM